MTAEQAVVALLILGALWLGRVQGRIDRSATPTVIHLLPIKRGQRVQQ